MTDPLHQAPVAQESVGVVINHNKVGTIKFFSE